MNPGSTNILPSKENHYFKPVTSIIAIMTDLHVNVDETWSLLKVACM